MLRSQGRGMKDLYEDAEAPYREVLPFDVRAFVTPRSSGLDEHPYRTVEGPGDAELALRELEEAATTIFKRWAREMPAGPADAGELIRGVRPEVRLIARVTAKIERRRFAWRSASYDGEDEIGDAPLSSSALDAFHPPSELRDRSRHVAACLPCGGEGRVSCLMCARRGSVTCVTCGGEGRESGSNIHRFDRLECRRCRGKKIMKCPNCTRGTLRCEDCRGTTRQERWLEVTLEARPSEVRVSPAGALRAFSWASDAAVDDEGISRDAEVVCRVTVARALQRADLPPLVPERWLEGRWAELQIAPAADERVIEQSLVLLRVPAVEVTYQVGPELQRVSFMGRRLLAPSSGDLPFRRRALRLRLAGAGLAAPPAAILYGYASGLLVLGATLGLLAGTIGGSLLLYRLLARYTLRRGAAALPGAPPKQLERGEPP